MRVVVVCARFVELFSIEAIEEERKRGAWPEVRPPHRQKVKALSTVVVFSSPLLPPHPSCALSKLKAQ